MSANAGTIPELRMTLPARRENLALVRHVVRGFRDAYAIDPDLMDDIVLAVSEAATNVAVHAYGDRLGSVTIVARLDAYERLQVLIRDDGCGITPDAEVPLPGHGLSLMAHVAATLEIAGSPLGTDVTMSFDLTPELERRAPRDSGAAL
jgi:anti-sigma regulatory factor (Ser/Thr protein kinase)